jgi:DDE superfamily endonuclease
MDHINNASESQKNIKLQSKIDGFFDRFQIGTLLHRYGIRKRHGHSVRSLTQAIFTLPFVGKNFFRGIVINKDLAFGKDAAYELLKATNYNWRRLLLHLGQRLHRFFNRLTDEDRQTVLIIDDSPYDRSRSKLVELLCRVYDHSTRRYLKGFRMLTVCWPDGVSCLPLDFALLSSADAKKRLCDSQKVIDKRCCAYQRRKEAVVKTTGHLEAMVKRILSAGIQAQYLLMDNWFTMPATVTTLAEHIDVIGMVRKSSRIFYRYNGKTMDLMAIYRKLKKRPGRAKILAATRVQLKDGRWVKLMFVRDKRKKDWLALLSTDTGSG